MIPGPRPYRPGCSYATVPGVLLVFELVILILFGLLVEYDEGGQAEHEETVARLLANKTNSSNGDDVILQLDSTRSTTKVYPCKRNNYTRNYMTVIDIIPNSIYGTVQ